ncbi:putative vacuolar membrane transporter for cationic amino acids [Maublancomyces gigas]|uniref:Vacuolar membrane transporter for cationic amino acids n=1 Tax=Discina gigas TaxID=1032678 RepID=A0ABR3GUX0_9PEZI
MFVAAILFQRGSAEGLSLAFLIAWLAGDLFNVLGALFQGVLPTMVILAVYYTFADLTLLFQCLYYRRLASLASRKPPTIIVHTPLDITATTPLLSPDAKASPSPSPPPPPPRPSNILSTILINTFSIIGVSAIGILGWYLTHHTQDNDIPVPPSTDITFSPLGQLFGYLSAFLYLASRIPQILLNFRRKSCDGISLLFFLFACVGNLTFVLSILAYVPREGGSAEWRRYVAVNASWLAGSFGTLMLDLGIFVQFFWYRGVEGGNVGGSGEV